MRELIAHAASLGVSVHVAHIDGPERGFYDAAHRAVVYDYGLTPVERDTVLAHELGHVFYDHRCRGNARFEEAADYYAACLLIDPAAYIAAESLDPSVGAIAEELGVEPKLVRVFERRALTRLDGVTYVQSRMGAGQYRFVAQG